jgi:hypothetical protein
MPLPVFLLALVILLLHKLQCGPGVFAPTTTFVSAHGLYHCIGTGIYYGIYITATYGMVAFSKVGTLPTC